MEEKDYEKTKDKLFAKAMDDKEMTDNQGIHMMSPSPYNINLKTTDKGEVENVGASAQLGNFSIGGSYNPGFTNKPENAPSFIPESEFKVPSTYNVGVTYKKGPFSFNYQHGTRGYSAGANVDMQF